jgi:hypothetical protein
MWQRQNRNGSSRFGSHVELSFGGGYMPRDPLEIDVVFCEGLFEVVGAIVVKDVEFGCEPV